MRERIYEYYKKIYSSDYDFIYEIIENSADFYWNNNHKNTYDLSNYLCINEFYSSSLFNKISCLQNLDGGLGLEEGYSSDIIDTKLALQALWVKAELQLIIQPVIREQPNQQK